MTAGRGTPERRDERLARHAAETDPAVVLAAAVRLLEARSRSVADLRSRLLKSGLSSGARRSDASTGSSSSGCSTTRRMRGAGSRRATAGGRAASGCSARNCGCAACPRTWPRPPGRAARRSAIGETVRRQTRRPRIQLLERRAAALARVTDPRVRRQRAYALLARNGFDPDVASRVAGALHDRRVRAREE